ncbi:sensory histidine kinase UhpB [compost metagenome]
MAIVYLGVSAFAAHNFLYGQGGGVRQAFLWGALTALALGIASLVFPWLAALERRGRFKVGGLKPWVSFYGVVALSLLMAGALRAIVAPFVLGEAVPSRYWTAALNFTFSSLATIVFLEMTAARIRADRAWSAEQERVIQDLERSQRDLIAVDDALRQETAEYLHGEMQSRFLVAWAQLDQARATRQADPEAADRLIAQACEHLAHLRSQGLLQARELFGLASAGEPLLATVEEVIRRLEIFAPITLEIQPEARSLADRMPAEIKRAGIRLLEEVLLNACRHAHPSAIRVAIAPASPTALSLRVQDDGLGFAPDRVAIGLGLSGLAQVLRRHGGRFTLDSRPGEGTCAEIQLPLAALVEGGAW